MDFLEPFKEVTTLMSGSTYPTLSMTIPLFNFLIDHVEDTIGDEENIEESSDDEDEGLHWFMDPTDDLTDINNKNTTNDVYTYNTN